MRTLSCAKSALGIALAGAFLAACSGSQPAIGGPGAMPQTSRASSSYQVLYSFDRYPDGQAPLAGLTDVNGVLYGTASIGGMRNCPKKYGCGTLFSITPSGAESLVFTFSRLYGVYPESGLRDVNGTLYGTTYEGGTATRGTLYSISTTGSETVIHDFAGHLDGALPMAEPLYVNGTLYGTTTWGGKRAGFKCCGTVYSVTTSGTEKVLHHFPGGTDGGYPLAGLIDVRGILYGTTSRYGGACHTNAGCGTFFSITTTGDEKVLYRFTGGSDGAFPWGNLLRDKGILYGTTGGGGGSGSGCVEGCGTVFSITTGGAEKVLYRFAGGSDGQTPNGGLIDVDGTLYGTTTRGGGTGCGNDGCGTIFSVSTSGVEKVLYSFAGGSDGMYPQGPVVDVNGTLYGTTSKGGGTGCGGDGCGTIFALTL
jgi:uncharacterized repeat protein (TIGR03803 family)